MRIILILLIISTSFSSCKEQTNLKSESKETSYDIIIPDTLRLGKNIGQIINFKSNKNKDSEYLLTVFVDNHYSESKFQKDTFSDGTLSPFFGISTFKKGHQEIKYSIEEKELITKEISKDSSVLRIIDKTSFYTLKVYVADENYKTEISERLEHDWKMKYEE